MKINIKHLLLIVMAFGLSTAFAGDQNNNLASLANNVRSNLAAVADLIVTIAFIAGIFFVLSGLAKFKAHKDNPAQTPISAPIVLLIIGFALMFFPSILTVGGSTLFGGSEESAQEYLKDGGVFQSGS